MKNILLTVGFIFLGSLACAAVEIQPTNAYDFEKLTISSSTASGFTAAKLAPSNSAEVKSVFITVETTDIRFRMDGTDPDQTTGHLVATTTSGITITGEENIRNFSMIGIGAASTVQVTYER